MSRNNRQTGGPEPALCKASAGRAGPEQELTLIPLTRPDPAGKVPGQKTGNVERKHTMLLSFIIKTGIFAAVLAGLLLFVATVRIVRTNDMYPFIRDGQLILVSRLSRVIGDSVVLYRTPDGGEQLGRVMAMPGQVVEITDNEAITINGNVLYQTVPYATPPGSLVYPYTVPEDAFFLLNDYREMENDSRTYGAVPAADVVGVVVFTMQYRGF